MFIIRPEQLYSSKLQQILSAIQSAHKQGKPIDIISVMEQLGVQTLESIGGIGYLTDLAGSVPSAESLSFYQEVVS
ncbi:DnaB-like helicase N-terminal domain-containing protein [Peribacillus deserti]|uniref:DNA helicase DnaB-like N-terminal domain-containing protein n=1 Tax=Peribacillus deserti TaxID=673318 RepID=A0A2N5MBT0_9BACI|nr:DnaB-like helicase N-terminal domain-containing protein [Peribacillus deserti]PLT31797.1 hypothetical protein CUU66_01160 [Peribacillus deserti]